MSRRANGEGSFIKLEDGRIRMRQQYGFLPSGYQRILTVTGSSRSECVKLMKKKIAKTPPPVDLHDLSKGTVEELCRKHLEYNLAQRGFIKPSSADRREVTINNQVAGSTLGNMQVAAVSCRDIENHIEDLINADELAVSTIKKVFHVINGAYKWAVSQEIISKNPCDPIKEKITQRFSKLTEKGACDADVIVLSDDEKIILIKEALRKDDKGNFLYPIGPSVVFLLKSGMRIGEYCALRWGNFWHDEEWTKVTVTIKKTRHYVKKRLKGKSRYTVEEGSVKNAHARTIELSRDAVDILKQIRGAAKNTDDEEYVFLNKRGKPSNPSNMDTLINKLYRNAGLDESITGAHILRHTFATDLFYQGAQIKSIASYIGDLESTTAQYYIAIRKTIRAGDRALNVVPIPKTAGKRADSI